MPELKEVSAKSPKLERNTVTMVNYGGTVEESIEMFGADAVNSKMSDLGLTAPRTIDAEELLYKAQAVFHDTKVDSLVVVSQGKVVGLLDVQDMIK